MGEARAVRDILTEYAARDMYYGAGCCGAVVGFFGFILRGIWIW